VQRLFISRLLETFFRRWWLYLVPVVLFVALGMFSVLNTGTTYRSTGVLLVNRTTVLGKVVANSGDNPFGYDTPAVYASKQINTVLGTRTFLDSVVNGANVIVGAQPNGDPETRPLTDMMNSGEVSMTLDDIRKSIAATPGGDELLAVTAVSEDPRVAQALAQSTIDSWWNFEGANADVAGEGAAKYLQQELQKAIEKQTAATQELERYTASLPPIGEFERRPDDQAARIDGLRADVTRADETVTGFENALDEANSEGARAREEVKQTYQPLDDPLVPLAPEGHRMQDVQTLVLYFGLGLLVSAAALVVATLMDRSVRYSEELEDRLNIPVVASVPDSSDTVKRHVA
jgi:uncharacterized protein involved in exopolysaccharide biosynthesis